MVSRAGYRGAVVQPTMWQAPFLPNRFAIPEPHSVGLLRAAAHGRVSGPQCGVPTYGHLYCSFPVEAYGYYAWPDPAGEQSFAAFIVIRPRKTAACKALKPVLTKKVRQRFLRPGPRSPRQQIRL